MLYKLLVIGNGFDLYHGLPTRYSDFITFVKCWESFYNTYNPELDSDGQFSVPLNDKKLCEDSMIEFSRHGGYDSKEISYLNENMPSNLWIKYFVKLNSQKEGWIDFEEEMLEALKKIDHFYKDIRPQKGPNDIPIKEGKYASDLYMIMAFGEGLKGFNARIINSTVSDRDLSGENLTNQRKLIIEALQQSLDSLNQCLRIYLSEFVSRIKVNCYSEQIKRIGTCNVLSFNYTYTYQNDYDQREGGDNHAIHGELKKNNLVLGIPLDAFPETEEYSYFAKYYQRQIKNTGNIYYQWITYKRTALDDLPLEVHMFGHSLGTTDKEILLDIFEADKDGHIYIYYHNQSAHGELLNGLSKLIGRQNMEREIKRERICFIPLEKEIEVAGD